MQPTRTWRWFCHAPESVWWPVWRRTWPSLSDRAIHVMTGSQHHHHPTASDTGRSTTHAAPSVQVSAPTGRASEHRFVFKIHGMDCAEEVEVLRREVGPVVGGEDRLSFDVLNGRMMIGRDADDVSAEVVREAVARTGMSADDWRPESRNLQVPADRQRRFQAALTAASGFFVVLGLALHAFLHGTLAGALGVAAEGPVHALPVPAMAAFALAIVLGGRYVVVKAWYAARRLRPDMNLLMTIAVIGAIGIGEWFEAATVAFLFALSLALESWSVGRARRAIAALLDLAPPTAHLVRNGEAEHEVLAADVPVGARFVVKPGERIPLDGRVAAGESSVNQAPITGESVPVFKQSGAEVFAGTINGDGALEVVSTKRAEDTTLAHIIRLVEDAQGRRARAEQWVDRFAKVYTPVVMALAIAVALVPPLLFGDPWDTWIYRALVLLVIACPCALVISTPVSIVAALAASARAGVLVKGGIHLETPGQLKAIAFDKTGTLTEGRPVVVDIKPLNGHDERELLARAAALEVRSTHPLAKAIVAFARGRGIEPIPADNVQIFPGKGVGGTFDGRAFWLGSHRYLEERGQETADVHDCAEAWARTGRTVIAIGNEAHVCGLIAVADTVRPEAAATVQQLRDAGIEHIVMLTGDNRGTAESIAQAAGIDEVHAELLPADKVAVIESLVAKYGSVAMVGDGVNDAPAMARASLGIAMGAAGSDAAIEAADVALMSDDLAKLPWLVDHAKRTLAVIHQNIAFSLAVKAAFVVLTFAGFASLWGAIAADVGASLLVVANGLRLLGRQSHGAPRHSGQGQISARPAPTR